MNSKRSLLIPIQWYHPGFRAGGITQATKRLAEAMQDHFQIFILTTNRDHSSKVSYPQLSPNKWLETKEGIQIKYLSPEKANHQQLAKEIKAIEPDLIYLKSMFNPLFSLFPLWLKYSGQTKAKLIIAPSGMLKETALRYKLWKKNPVLTLIRLSGMHKKVSWHATDKQEYGEIQNQMGSKVNIFLLSEFPPKLIASFETKDKKGPLKLLYLSRIHPVKNLAFLLEVLNEVRSPIDLTIGGPVEDIAYDLKCQRLVTQLPSHIIVNNIGEVPHESVKDQFHQHHVFILPSRGEGFGNVILEAFSNGCPVIISDQTPWRDLQKASAGWDLSLMHPETFVKAIETFVEMDQETYDNYCSGALAYAKESADQNELTKGYCSLLGSTILR